MHLHGLGPDDAENRCAQVMNHPPSASSLAGQGELNWLLPLLDPNHASDFQEIEWCRFHLLVGMIMSDFLLHKVEAGLCSSDPLCGTTRVNNIPILHYTAHVGACRCIIFPAIALPPRVIACMCWRHDGLVD